ncbi:hypothetical protein ACU4GD_18600 [Cupriavidus basilensis]
MGAGTVLTAADLQAVGGAGAAPRRFSLPGSRPLALAAWLRRAPAAALLPGVPPPPSGAMAAAGGRLQEFTEVLPAGSVGWGCAIGLGRSLCGPFAQLRFCPAGGDRSRRVRTSLRLAAARDGRRVRASWSGTRGRRGRGRAGRGRAYAGSAEAPAAAPNQA